MSASENDREAKFYQLTEEGRKQLARETSRWRQMTRAIGLGMGEELAGNGGNDELVPILSWEHKKLQLVLRTM